MDINKLYDELISEFENRGEFFYIKPSSDKEDLINQFEKFNSQNDDQKQRADTHSLNIYGMTNYDHYHILLNKLRDDSEDKLIYKDEEMVNEDYYLYDQEKINSAIKFNMHTIGQVIIYPTKDIHELESLYARYMNLEPNEKCEADEEAKQLFGLDNIGIYNHMKEILGKESKEVEDTHEPEEVEVDKTPIFNNDLPLVTPLELSQKVEENYSCFTKAEAEYIKRWRQEYCLMGTGINTENYNMYNLERINILRKAIHENNTEAIIQCGWVPGIEFNSENRAKASKLIREKIEVLNNKSVEESSKVKDHMPKQCSKCGSTNIGCFFAGEPIYKCKDCGQYLGTVPFPSKTESYIEEARSLPIKIDDDGNLIIKNIRKINFEQEYADSHRLLKEYEKTESYEPMKFELAKMQFFITLLEKRIYKNGKKESPDELKVRARFLNDFKKYLKILNTEYPDFNFREYYEQSQFNDALIKIDKNTLKYGFEALKYTAKSILKG